MLIDICSRAIGFNQVFAILSENNVKATAPDGALDCVVVSVFYN